MKVIIYKFCGKNVIGIVRLSVKLKLLKTCTTKLLLEYRQLKKKCKMAEEINEKYFKISIELATQYTNKLCDILLMRMGFFQIACCKIYAQKSDVTKSS